MRLTTYKTKTYIDGYKLDSRLAGKMLIAIPEHKLPSPSQVLKICIKSIDGVMFLRHEDLPSCLAALPFCDKWGRGSYRLCYFEVKLDMQQLSFGFLKEKQNAF